MKKMNRFVSFLLVLCMVLTLLPASVFAVQTADVQNTQDVEFTQVEAPELGLLKDPAADLATEEQGYAETDMVTVIVVMEEKSLLDQGYSKKQIVNSDAALKAAKEALAVKQDALVAEIASVTGEKVEMGYRYSVILTGFSVEVPYGALAQIQAMDGVKSAFVAPVYSVPEDQTQPDAAPYTQMTTTTFGSALTWQNAGYTGAGMRIAILDTGLDLDHPSFVDAPELTETSLTRAEVEGVLPELNATSRYRGNLTAAQLYRSEKVPYGFNYGSDSLDVSHDFDLSGDHGTHVAGIAAANAIESTNVVGVAPDAQIIVMKVFQPSGGAAFDDIIAALEDCYRLDVDAINMSLGSPAGFSTVGEAVWDEVYAKINENDMIAAVAGGNSYSAAYGNGYGTNKNLTADPDNSTVSSPATWAGTTTIASLENSGVMSQYFTVGENEIPYLSNSMYLLTDLEEKTVEYVMVPGVGTVEDLAKVDVAGKIAVISRGEIAFTEKQTNAHRAGAIACIVYDNAEGDLIYMEDAFMLPHAFISKADGEIMAANAVDGVGTLEIKEADDYILVESFIAGRLSDFSSWGVSPDLQLNPEVTAPGGNIYSSLNNGTYGVMSGTSMAAPHIAGMAALVLQHLRETHPELTDAQMHTVAEALIMSTATPVMETEEVEYSPRKQGAGAANVYDAVTSGAYLTVNGATPKVSLGDDDAKNGTYTFTFEINNFSDEALSYELDASLLTDLVDTSMSEYGYLFMGETSKALSGTSAFYILKDAEGCDPNGDGYCDLDDVQYLLDGVVGLVELSEEVCAEFDLDEDEDLDTVDVQMFYEMIVDSLVEVETVTVEAGKSLTVTVKLALSDEDKTYMDTYYPNGIYVDAFVRAYALDEESVDLSLPIVGFYGDWSDSRIFDGGWYYEPEEEAEVNRYMNVLWTDFGTGNSYYLGMNPYLEEAYDPAHNVLSPNGDHYLDKVEEIYLSLMRNAKSIRFTYTDNASGEVLHDSTAEWVRKTYYEPAMDLNYPFIYGEYLPEIYDFTDAEGNYLANGTELTLTIEACLDDGDEIVDDSVVVPLAIDTEAPTLLNVRKLHDVENGDIFLEISFSDNNSVAAVGLLNADGTMLYAMDAAVDGEPDENGYQNYTMTYDVTDMGGKLMLVLADYAVNEVYYGLNLYGTGSTYGNLLAYQYNVFTGTNSWVSFNENVNANETGIFMDDLNFVCAEYVNGCIFAQTETGDLYGIVYDSMLGDTMELEATFITQLDNVYQDLAYSYAEGKLYGLYTYEDDGYPYTEINSINIKGEYYDADMWMNVEAYQEDWAASRGGVYGLGLACDDNGTLYVMGPNYDFDTETMTDTAHLWTSSLQESWGYVSFGSFKDLGDTGLTMDFLQSMAWDHNTETLYWARFAPDGWDVICELLTVDPATAQCTKVGTLTGETCALMAPLREEAAAAEAHANVPDMDSDEIGTPVLRTDVLTMNVGNTESLLCDFDPWYTTHKDLVWSTSNPDVAVVDENGVVTATGIGSATITVANKEDETKLDTCAVEVAALNLKIEGVVSAQAAGMGNVAGTSLYEFNMVDGVASFNIGNRVSAPAELNFGLSLASTVAGRGSVWACEFGNTGMLYELDAETGVVKDALQPIDGDMIFGMAYSEELDLFTGIMNMYLYVDQPFTHDVEDDMIGSYDEDLHEFTWHKINMLPYLLESNTGFLTNETGNGAMSEIVFAGITSIDTDATYTLSKDYMGNYSYYETVYTPDQTLVLLDNVGRLWYIDEVTNMTRFADDWGNVTYMSEDGTSMIPTTLNGVEALEYQHEDGTSTYSVFVIRELVETPMTNMFRSGTLPRITYHFSDLAYAGETADGAPMYLVSMYDYWNEGTTNELYLYIPGVGTGEFTFDDNWNYVEVKTADRLYTLGNTGEHNIIATLHHAEVTGGVDPVQPEEGTDSVNYLTASVYTGETA